MGPESQGPRSVRFRSRLLESCIESCEACGGEDADDVEDDTGDAEVGVDGGGPPEVDVDDDGVGAVMAQELDVGVDGLTDAAGLGGGYGVEVFDAGGQADGREWIEEEADGAAVGGGAVEGGADEGSVGGGEDHGGLHARASGKEAGEVGHGDNVSRGEEGDEENPELACFFQGDTTRKGKQMVCKRVRRTFNGC